MKNKTKRKARLLQSMCQGFSLFVFLWLLCQAGAASSFLPPPDIFLRLDPLLAATLPITLRAWIPTLLPGLCVLALAVVLGRFFCGYICPMGATLDLARWFSNLFKKKTANASAQTQEADHRRWIKYLLLTIMLASALAGINIVFWGSPLALITRFYALLVEPILLLPLHLGLSAAHPLFDNLGLTTFSYMQVTPRRYDALLFVFAFFALLFWLERVRPRFWCRYLCPAGALLGLLSLRPLWRRRVRTCVSCGQCVGRCPIAAIADDGLNTRHNECIACRSCVDVCPVEGLVFAVTPFFTPKLPPTSSPQEEDPPSSQRQVNTWRFASLPSRRAVIGAAGAGLLLAATQYSAVRSLLQADGRGLLWPDKLIRPPGAVPEAEFLGRCIRCGECMKVCPSNALQPFLLPSGLDQIFSPVLIARRGPCEPGCNRCGQVCPTQAIQSLPLAEKQWAKIGTAVVLPYRCLAWAEERSCMVCQETCPYGAVTIVQKDGLAVPVPVVNAARCYGCGYCEHHCPVRLAAIVVQPLNALRLKGMVYQETARSAGLILEPGTGHQDIETSEIGEDELPPGFLP